MVAQSLVSKVRGSGGSRSLRLVLAIDENQYTVRRLRCDAGIGRRAFQLEKPDGTQYDVVQTRFGPECDCPDFVFRRDGLDPAGCKHVKALVAYGLLESSSKPRPARSATAPCLAHRVPRAALTPPVALA